MSRARVMTIEIKGQNRIGTILTEIREFRKGIALLQWENKRAEMEAEDLREAELEAAEDIVNSTVAQTLSEEAIQTRELFQTITSVVPQSENTLASMLSVPEGSEDPVDRQREEREQIIGRLAVIHADLAGAMARFDQAVVAEA